MKYLSQNAHWLLRVALAETGGGLLVLAGGFEFQAVLLLLMLYVAVTGNNGLAATKVEHIPPDQLPTTASTVAG